MKSRMLSLVVMSVGVFVGCAAQDGANGGAATRDAGAAQTQQRYHIDLVRARAAELRQGMSRAEVYLLLGAPAEYRGDTWVYRSESASDDDVFRVRFDGDRYVESSAG